MGIPLDNEIWVVHDGAGSHPLDGPDESAELIGQGGSGGSRQRAPELWMQDWTALAEDLWQLGPEGTYSDAPFDWLARGVPSALVGEERRMAVRDLATGVLGQLREAVHGRDEDHGSQAILAWAAYVCDEQTPSQIERIWRVRNTGLYARLGKDPRKTIGQRMWAKGLAEPAGYYVNAAAGLRRITLSLLLTMEARGYYSEDVYWRELALDLLPEPLALTLHDGRRHDYVPKADTLVPALMPLQRKALPRLHGLIASGGAMLVDAPPGCGKTHLARLAAAHALKTRPDSKVLLLLPQKALVHENFASWTDWLAECEAVGLRWRVVPGSADHRPWLRQLSRGDFDIAIAIYETVANLLATPRGQRTILAHCSLVIADELQTLADPRRGPRLEQLLTALTRRKQGRPAILALSPVLAPAARGRLSHWLEVAPEDRIHDSERPVDLTLHTFDGSMSRWRKERRRPVDPEPVVSDRTWTFDHLGWPELLSDSIHRDPRKSSIKLICHLVAEQQQTEATGDERILCFVSARQEAEAFAEMIAQALNQTQGVAPVQTSLREKRVDPWSKGRWKPEPGSRWANEGLERFRRAEATKRTRRSLARLLQAGVAFHSAALSLDMRAVIEHEFAHGIVRVLVATDTLAEGVNLPASSVIVSDLWEYDRRGHRQLADRSRVQQRAGRAGRFNLQEEGEAFLVVNTTSAKTVRDPHDIAAMTNVRKAFDHFVEAAPDGFELSSGLLKLRGRRRLDATALLVLQSLTAEQAIGTRIALLEQINDVLNHTFAHVDDGLPAVTQEAENVLATLERALLEVAPDDVSDGFENDDDDLDSFPDEEEGTSEARILARLEELHVVGQPPHSDALLHVNPLGYAVARVGLPIRAARRVTRIAEAKRRGAGDMSLIYLAASSHQAESLRVDFRASFLQNARDLPELVAVVQQRASAYGHPQVSERMRAREELAVIGANPEGIAVTLRPGEWSHEAPSFDEQDPLRWMITVPPDVIVSQLTAEMQDPARDRNTQTETQRLLRGLLMTTIMMEWANSEPIDNIEQRLHEKHTLRTRGDIGGRQGSTRPYARCDATDINNMGEQIGYMLRAAADLLSDAPVLRSELRALAERCASGLPAIASGLLRLRVPGLGRESLLPLAGISAIPDDPEELLQYVDVGDDIKETVRDRLRESRRRWELERWTVPHDVGDSLTPRGEATYRQAIDTLREAAGRSLDAAVETFDELLDQHHLVCDGSPTIVGPTLAVFEITDGARRASVGLAFGRLTRATLARASEDIGLLIPLTEISYTIWLERGDTDIRSPADFVVSLAYQAQQLREGRSVAAAMMDVLCASPSV
jgi:superfamily II DNA/RNA helicase